MIHGATHLPCACKTREKSAETLKELEESTARNIELSQKVHVDSQSEDRRRLLMRVERAETRARSNEVSTAKSRVQMK